MKYISNRSLVNVNNMKGYSKMDRKIDQSLSTEPAPAPTHTPPAPLRDRLTGEGKAPLYSVRVYSGRDDRPYLGMAMSKDTLLALIESAYHDADRAVLKGRIDGHRINEVIDQQQFDTFRRMVS